MGGRVVAGRDSLLRGLDYWLLEMFGARYLISVFFKTDGVACIPDDLLRIRRGFVRLGT